MKLTALVFFSALFCFSCTKHEITAPPVTTWEDTGPDSAALRIIVRTAQGKLVSSQYVNIALSSDSLKNKILVRNPAYTNASGIVTFRRLYPRIIFYDCKVIQSTDIFYGAGSVRLIPGATKDTTLMVY